MSAKWNKVNVARVFLWGKQVGAVAWDEARQLASFEYDHVFLREGFDIAPIFLPRRAEIFSFPTLNPTTFHGLPGLLSDSLPDRFGNALIDTWLARQGRAKDDFSPVERLCYIGTRGMGALEFKPPFFGRSTKSDPIEIAELTELAQKILDSHAGLNVKLDDGKEALKTIFRIGTSAGGARPKALIAWNPATNEVRSGQVAPPPGFELWILKFDGVHDKVLGDSEGYGRVEYAYFLMARDAGIEMNECRVYPEGSRSHFMTRRFDRTQNGEKIHMLSLCGLAHFDFNMARAYGYEQAFAVMQQLNLGYPALGEMFRRMVFNIVARNQDDHTRNIAFLMDHAGKWKLSPAFDIMWAYNPSGPWTGRHQMTVHGKSDGFTRANLIDVARQFGIKNAEDIIKKVMQTVAAWPDYAAKAGVTPERTDSIGSTHRLSL